MITPRFMTGLAKSRFVVIIAWFWFGKGGLGGGADCGCGSLELLPRYKHFPGRELL